MLRTAATALLVICFSSTVRADCDCIWGGSFVDVQADTDLVAAVQVLRGKGNSLDFSIQEVLRGQEYLEEIRVWMNTGELCRPEVEEFPEGTQWVLALDRINESKPGDFDPNTPNISFGRVGDYSLSRCGAYWLSRQDELVSGNLINGTRWEREPKMSPVLLTLLAGYTQGLLSEKVLEDASRIDPELQRLQFETRLHLRRENRRSGYE